MQRKWKMITRLGTSQFDASSRSVFISENVPQKIARQILRKRSVTSKIASDMFRRTRRYIYHLIHMYASRYLLFIDVSQERNSHIIRDDRKLYICR